MEDPPSFSLGITQIMPSNTNRVYDNEDLGWAENRSKKLHDPLVMANVSIEKVKKDVLLQKQRLGKPLKKGVEKYHPQFLV